VSKDLGFKRIATEEAFATPELLDLYRQMLTNGTIVIAISRRSSAQPA